MKTVAMKATPPTTNPTPPPTSWRTWITMREFEFSMGRKQTSLKTHNFQQTHHLFKLDEFYETAKGLMIRESTVRYRYWPLSLSTLHPPHPPQTFCPLFWVSGLEVAGFLDTGHVCLPQQFSGRVAWCSASSRRPLHGFQSTLQAWSGLHVVSVPGHKWNGDVGGETDGGDRNRRSRFWNFATLAKNSVRVL